MNMIAPGQGKSGTEVLHLMQPTGRRISISAAQGWGQRFALAAADLSGIVARAMQAAIQRSRELAARFGEAAR